MASRLFGTDGVRGLANRDITAELALSLSTAAAHEMRERGEFNGSRLVAVVGRDPRASGEFLSSAVVAGLASAGVDVYDAGVLPTPAIAFLTKELGAALGVMLSASHNPMPDNGIKFFAPGGVKFEDSVEDAIEARLGEEWERPVGFRVGRVRRLSDANARYVAHLLSALPHRLDGIKVVIDGAHGAASTVSPQAFRAAGAEVKVIGTDPDGLNINDGYGSTHLQMLQTAVVELDADLGIAHDGDADRCLAVDHTGAPVDGDQIMAILAIGLKEYGGLAHDTLVTTVMSNLGLFRAMEQQGITVRKTAVGDRYVLEDMLAGGYNLGGEQSGHVILHDYATTGDGTLTGLFLAARLAQTGRELRELADVMKRLPQALINVKGVDKEAVDTNEAIAQAVAAAEAEMGDSGRVLLRKSGTEPLVRVMVEAVTSEQAHFVAGSLADLVRRELAI